MAVRVTGLGGFGPSFGASFGASFAYLAAEETAPTYEAPEVNDMISEVSICNGALLLLGADTILTLTDNTNRARVMNQRYEQTRNAEIHKHRWRFAIKRASLPALSEAPNSDYAKQYELPADYIRIIDGGDLTGLDDSQDAGGCPGLFSVEGRRLLTNLTAPLRIRYLARIEDPTLFNPSFVDVLAAKLAWDNCERITQSDAKKEHARTTYKDALREAIRANALETASVKLPEDSWATSRR